MKFGEHMIRQSEKISQLMEALSKAQGAFPVIDKNREVEVYNKEHTRIIYTFKYADLTEIIAKTRPALSAHGISFTQSMDVIGETPFYFTRLMHASGEWLDTGWLPISITKGLAMKDVAGALTYGKRLSLSAALGVAADDDNDAPDHEAPKASQPKELPKKQAQEHKKKMAPVAAVAVTDKVTFAQANKIKSKGFESGWTVPLMNEVISEYLKKSKWGDLTLEEGDRLWKIFSEAPAAWIERREQVAQVMEVPK